MKESGLTEPASSRCPTGSPTLGTSGHAAKTSYLGEGGYFIRHNLYGMTVKTMVDYDADYGRIKDWVSRIGKPLEEAFGAKPGQQVILGHKNGTGSRFLHRRTCALMPMWPSKM